MAVSDLVTGTVGRAVNVAGALAEAHLILARAEAERDAARAAVAVALIALGATCLVSVWTIGQLLAILILQHRGLSWPGALGAVAGADLVLGVSAMLIGRSQLRRPFLVESRALLKKTWLALKG